MRFVAPLSKMAPRKSLKSRAKATKKKAPKVVRARVRDLSLDSDAQRYAYLLSNPCDAPLTHPVYAGGDGGYLVRTQSVLNYPTAAGQSNQGYIHWTPGATSGSNVEILGNSTGVTWGAASAQYLGGYSPGKTFLANNASTFRCVAACVRVSYPGAELNRGGMVYYGNTTGGLIKIGDTFSPEVIGASLTHSERAPAGEIEIVWKPTDADQILRNPDTLVAVSEKDRLGAVTIAFKGLPDTVGLQFRFFAVWEWQPEANIGITEANQSRAVSRNSLDDVVNYLQRKGFNFMRSTATSAMHTALTGMSNYFGVNAGVARLTM